jgi:uncharacterized protein HemX
MGLQGLLAVMLAVVLGLPGISGAQGTQSRGRYADSPRQADKSFATDQQKKGRQQIRKKGQKPQTQKKVRRQGAKPASQSQPPTKALRGGSTGTGVQ